MVACYASKNQPGSVERSAAKKAPKAFFEQTSRRGEIAFQFRIKSSVALIYPVVNAPV